MDVILTPIGMLWVVPSIGIIAIIIALILRKKIFAEDPGNEEMRKIQAYIKEGADAFIKRQYKTIFYVVLALACIIGLAYFYTEPDIAWLMVIAYLIGSGASASAGWIGLQVGIKANAPTANAAKKGLSEAFKVSFFGGAIMGLLVTGIALIGVWVLYWIFGDPIGILGFSFGASSIALFMKAGGGIYTKTADVAADLVGKLEFVLPEDDSRNPAAVADNVGDNVGDIAGMGADLFDSYVASLVAAMLLAYSILRLNIGYTDMEAWIFASFPPIISASGLLASMFGIFIVRKFVKSSPGGALNLGTLVATLFYIAISALFTWFLTMQPYIKILVYYPDLIPIDIRLWRNWLAGVFGVCVGLSIGFTTDYYTNDEKKPVQKTAEASQRGHALTILTGFSYGLYSIVPPAIGIIVAMILSWWMDGIYGIANAAVGMLAIVGTIVSNDAYGPITDNARGIAEQGKLDPEVIAICDKLDSAGNTAKAVTKGFAIGAAMLTVLALMYSYFEEANKYIATDMSLDLLNITTLIGAIIGCIIPPFYSGILIQAVNKNAQIMVEEIRRQFTEQPGILKGEVKADFARCVDIATKGAIKALTVPVILAIGVPFLTGILFGIQALGALLASSILTGMIFAILMSNAGGMWDNAKKYIEDGHYGGKGTPAHAAAVTGDTVGDPFKDTAGPSINTLICVMGLTASLFLIVFAHIFEGNGLISLLL